MKNIQKLTLAAVIAATTQYASAGLYIAPSATSSAELAPAAKKEAFVETPAESEIVKANPEAVKAEAKPEPVKAETEAKVEAVEQADAPEVKESFGKNIPIELAVDTLNIPKSWKVNFDDTINGMEVSWNGGLDWQGVLESIAENNDVTIALNVDDKIIGISEVEVVAVGLANVEPSVWRLIEGRSLRENLDIWATKAGYTLAWDAQIDYPIEHPTVIEGDVRRALALVLEAVSKGEKPLSATIHKGNKVIQIVNGGFMSGAK